MASAALTLNVFALAARDIDARNGPDLVFAVTGGWPTQSPGFSLSCETRGALPFAQQRVG